MIKRGLGKVLLALTLMLVIISSNFVMVNAEVTDRETLQINQSLSYTGLEAPGYTFESSLLTKQETVGAMVFNISIDLPVEGDVSWNDWCGELLTVRVGDSKTYYDFGGAQVGWGVDMTGDDNPDTSGVGTESWVGSAANGAITLVVPVNAKDFAVDFYDNCWDSAADINHYTINSATAVYGDVADTEMVSIDKELTYTGLTDPGYTFTNSDLTTQGNVAAVAFNISIALPMEGDVSWNDWCGEAAAVTVGDMVTYYDFGGAQVGWGVDMTGDDNPDTSGVGTASWVGSAENGALSILIPVNAEEFSIALYDNCWDSAADIPHLKVNSATAIFGSIAGGGVVEEAPVVIEDETPQIPAFDSNGTYHAYLSVQSENFIFRNQWADADFGPNGGTWEKHSIGNNFNDLTGWDGPNAVAYDGAFTDVEIKGNGTYQVSLRDFDFGNDSAFNLLYLSTDIPMEGNPLTFTDVKVIMNGNTKYTFDQGIIPGIDTKDAKDYYEVHCINIWNNDQLGGKEGLFSNNIPSSSIALEFTVNGFAYDKAVEEVVEEEADVVEDVKEAEKKAEDDSATKETISEEDSWIKSNWIVVVIAAALVVAVIIVVVVIRMKGKKSNT